MFPPIRGQGGHLGFLIGTKNTNLIEGVEDLLPVKFSQNPFSGCGEEAEKCFRQSEDRDYWISDRHEKRKLDRGH